MRPDGAPQGDPVSKKINKKVAKDVSKWQSAGHAHNNQQSKTNVYTEKKKNQPNRQYREAKS